MRSVNIGLIGLGTIGMGVFEAIQSNGGLIADRTGVSLKIKGVCDKDPEALAAIDEKVCSVKTSDAADLIGDGDIDIIVELIGGVNPAKGIVLEAIRNKKHVVTANKALLSACGSEIFSAASDNGVFVNFEAAVGGAIPIIRAMSSSLVANNIETVYGILNGTTNFILTRMSENACSFDDALRDAQDKGIAESDPTLDVSGKDSAHKLAILALLAFGIEIDPEEIYTDGITSIGAQDILNAAKWGYSIKLLAIAKDSPAGLELRVHPTLLRSSHLLSDVKGADNAIFVKGDLVGESLLFGHGAGRKPTSSSVVGDIVEIARQVAFVGPERKVPYNFNYASPGREMARIDELTIPYYLRFSGIDRPGVLASISSVLAENNISIANVSQEERNAGEEVPVIILTHKAREGDMRKAIEKIDTLDCIANKTVVIRIEE